MERENRLLVLVYDGINNSVFQSQVFQPLVEQCRENRNLVVTLVSFENESILPCVLAQLEQHGIAIEVKIFKRPRFVGILSLWPAVLRVAHLLCSKRYDRILARGPLAGYIAFKGLSLAQKKPSLRGYSPTVMVQARGLCAQEYWFAHMHASAGLVHKLIRSCMYKSLARLERKVYAAAYTSNPFTIESVSPALKQYLVRHFGARTSGICIADKDIPKQVDKGQVSVWREQTRQELNIPEQAYVYCYSGSFKPWQCARESIEYVAKQFEKNDQAIFLVLSSNKQQFEGACKASNIDMARVRIVSVEPGDVTRYLAAADVGLLLRHKDPLNWVSRPTKLLEYQAVGLKIVHNNTIALLSENSRQD
ncbi:MAG: hypothetical protein H6679_02280 [Epsilonproteobacteria bacterium]|nr:hypothetical protein [Campylobacterota bacterium]